MSTRNYTTRRNKPQNFRMPSEHKIPKEQVKDTLRFIHRNFSSIHKTSQDFYSKFCLDIVKHIKHVSQKQYNVLLEAEKKIKDKVRYEKAPWE